VQLDEFDLIFNQFHECILAYSTNFSIHISLLWNIFSCLDFQIHPKHANQITLTRFENVLPLPINPSNRSRCNAPLCNAVDSPSQWKIAYPTPAKVGQAKFNICSRSSCYCYCSLLSDYKKSISYICFLIHMADKRPSIIQLKQREHLRKKGFEVSNEGAIFINKIHNNPRVHLRKTSLKDDFAW